MVVLNHWARPRPCECVGWTANKNGRGDGRAMLGDHAQHEIQVLKKVSKSALIVSAFVVGMPCGKPL